MSDDDLLRRLDIKAAMMEMGEKIAWGSDTALMREAAARIRELQARMDKPAKTIGTFQTQGSLQPVHHNGMTGYKFVPGPLAIKPASHLASDRSHNAGVCDPRIHPPSRTAYPIAGGWFQPAPWLKDVLAQAEADEARILAALEPADTIPRAEAEAMILHAAADEYTLMHSAEHDAERRGRRSAVRGMMMRLGLYDKWEDAIDAVFRARNEGGQGNE